MDQTLGEMLNWYLVNMKLRVIMRDQNIANLKTEKDGIIALKKHLSGFFVPTKEQKIILYEMAGVDYRKYYNSIDGVISHVGGWN